MTMSVSLFLAKKRKIYDNRFEKKNSYSSYNYGHHYGHNHHHHHNHDYTSTPSSHRRGNRYGFTWRGLFEPTPFYKIFGIQFRTMKWNLRIEILRQIASVCPFSVFHFPLALFLSTNVNHFRIRFLITELHTCEWFVPVCACVFCLTLFPLMKNGFSQVSSLGQKSHCQPLIFLFLLKSFRVIFHAID